jgi:L-ascorbate metabolism protein UlaG (beta-lactamase superfamily)
MRRYLWVLFLVGIVLIAGGQSNDPRTTIRMLTNSEAVLTITNVATTSNVTLRSYYSPSNRFLPLLTFRSTGVNNHIDTAAPYLNWRFYTATVAPPNAFLGDHIITTNGDLIIQPINHASFVMSWNGKMIYNDPVCAATLYTGFPKADLILLSHHHSDHFNTNTIHSVTNATTRIIAPQATYNAMPSPALRNMTTVLAYGASTTVQGISVQAVRATNAPNHLEGINNAYVTTIGGKRILTTGDCGPGPDLRALQDIDIMFVCMNSFTMEVPTAATLVREMRPKVVYPYHYGSQCSGPSYDVQLFKRLVANDLGIEVRLRKWY